MSKFKSSFEKGIESANEAKKSREEIEQVFYDLNKDLSEITNNKLEIVIHEFTENIGNGALASLGSILAGNSSDQYRNYLGLGARNPDDSSSIYEIARWSQGRAGYPCKIKFGNKSFICEDKDGLIDALSEMLEDPKIGETLQSIITN